MNDVPLREGLFAWPCDARRPRLYAAKCKACGKAWFPLRPRCGGCGSDALEKIEVGPRGTLHTFTICHSGAPGLATPYAIGFVDLPEGIKLFAPLAGEKFEVGMDVELEIALLKEEGGQRVHAFRFRPVTKKTLRRSNA